MARGASTSLPHQLFGTSVSESWLGLWLCGVGWWKGGGGGCGDGDGECGSGGGGGGVGDGLVFGDDNFDQLTTAAS